MKTSCWIIVFLLLTTSSFGRSIFKIEGNDVVVQLDGIGVKSKIIKVELWTTDVVKIITGMNETFSTTPSLIGNRSSEPVDFKASYAQNIIEISTEKLLINIEENGMVRLLSRDGKKLLIESSRSFTPSASTDGTFKVKERFFLSKHEHIYGMGQDDRESRYNLRGKSFDLEQSNSTVASPLFLSEKGYALIWDNYSATQFSDSPAGLEFTSETADEIQYFFVYGPDWTTILSQIRHITGDVPLLPKWAYGFWLNPSEYNNEAALNTAVERYLSMGIPVETKTSEDYHFLSEEKEITAAASNSNPRYANALAYSILKDKYDSLYNNTSDRRLCIPTHTNLPGIQQFGTFLVSGNITTCWETLNSQVGSGISSALSGQPYWSTAIGGTTPKAEINLDSNDELLVRWYQFAAFTPVFRGARDGKEIWQLGNETNTNFQAVAKAIKLRYQLLPYLYTSANDVVFNNKSMMRSMIFDSLTNESIHEIDKQYLLGKSIMVCPVTIQGANEIPVFFPAGNNWFDFHTGKLFTGNQALNIPVSIDHIPVFVKQGSILPIATLTKNSADSLDAAIEIRIYPGADAEYILYEDANDGKGYLKGQSTKIKFEYSDKSKTLSISAIEGSYTGMISRRTFRAVLVTDNNGIGTEYSTNTQEIQYKGKKVKIKLA